MEAKTGKDMANELSSFVNNYGCDEEGFVETATRDHRTLQQSMFRLFLKCIQEWSKQENFDLRNEDTITQSKKIMEALGNETFVRFV
jgi:hypothetical protein